MNNDKMTPEKREKYLQYLAEQAHEEHLKKLSERMKDALESRQLNSGLYRGDWRA